MEAGRSPGLPEQEVLQIVGDIVQGLTSINAMGIAHRNIRVS